MKISAVKIVNLYFAFWALTMPIVSFVLLPVQGTTPANIFALGSMGICLIAAQMSSSCAKQALRYLVTTGLLLLTAITLSAFGQIGLTLSHVNIAVLNLIDREQGGVLFRSTLFTQMLYFVACALTFSYVRYFFQPSWLRWIFAGAWLLALYGFYDWLFFAIFRRSGDFIVNRTFGVEQHTGSWTQTAQIAGLHLMRFKSFTGEPSMFALVGLPYFLLALNEGRKLLSLALLAALILSTSTSAYLGLVLSAVFITCITGTLRWQTAALIGASIGLAALLLLVFPDTFADAFVRKMSGENQSGQKRTESFTVFWHFVTHANPLNLLFGIGFGYVHAPVGQSMTLNSGILGYAIFAFGFLLPIFALPSDPQAIGLRAAVFGIFLLYNVSVAELFYPTTWMFLGMAYWRLDQLKVVDGGRRRASSRFKALPHRKVLPLALLSAMILSSMTSRGEEPQNAALPYSRFGVTTHFNKWDAEALIPLVARSGLGWIRDEVRWGDIEKEKGSYQIPEKTDRWINRAREYGLHIILVLNHGNLIYEDQFNAQAYSQAAAWLAHELEGKIDAIEILNEPENFGFRKYYGGRWNGWEFQQSVSPWVSKYVTLLNKAADAIKAANPRMIVIGLGSSPPVGFRELEMGIHRSVDGIVFHPYSRYEPEYVRYSASPRLRLRDGIVTADRHGSFASQVAMFRQQAKRFGGPDQLWLTEWGHSTYQSEKPEPRWHPVTAEQQAAFIARRMVESLGLNVTASIIYDFRDDCRNRTRPLCNFGLLTIDEQPKPSYHVVQRVCEMLNGALPSDGQVVVTKITPSKPDITTEVKSYLFQNKEGSFLLGYWLVKRPDVPLTADISVRAQGQGKNMAVSINRDVLTGCQPKQPTTRSGEDGIELRGVPLNDYPTFLTIRGVQ